MGRWGRILRLQIQLWRFCIGRLHHNNVAAMSAALSFRTIFALIPTIVLVVVVMRSVGMLEQGKQSLRQFLAASGFDQIALIRDEAAPVPAEPIQVVEEGEQPVETASRDVINIADRIESVVADVEEKLTFGRVGPVGILLLIWTALTLLTTMERSLNRIFGGVRSRPVGKRVLLYWSTLTLGPMALLAAVYLGQQATDAISATLQWKWFLAAASWAGSVCIGILVLAAIYKLLPNTFVDYRYAVGAAVIAVPLWLLAKWGFSIYVVKFVRSGNLYGALGLLPLFLLWLNLSWWIFLFGAQLAHTASNLGELQMAEESPDDVLTGADLLAAAVVVARPFVDGRGPASTVQVADCLRIRTGAAQKLLDHLDNAGVLCAVRGDDDERLYIPARPTESIAISEIVGLAGVSEGGTAGLNGDVPLRESVAATLRRARVALETLTLRDTVALSIPEGDRGPAEGLRSGEVRNSP
jgi:YihY family inner membrane protein